MFGPFHRLTVSEDEIRKVLASGELWGTAPRNYYRSDFPKVKAYDGPLPEGAMGFEFETEVPPDAGCVPGRPTWSTEPERPGVVAEGDYAKIKVAVLRQTVILR